MEPGSVGKGAQFNPALAKQVSQKKVADKKAPAEEVPVENAAEPQDMTTLAIKGQVATELLAPVTDENGNQTSEMEVFVAPRSARGQVEALGGQMIDNPEVLSDEGLEGDGHLALTSVEDTGNEATTYLVEPVEVRKSDLEVDPQTGEAPISTMSPVMLPEGTIVAPGGYEFQMGTSAAGAKTDLTKKRISKFGGIAASLGQSGLIGFLPIPGANLLAFGGSLLSEGEKSDALKTAQDTLNYLKTRQRTSETDRVELEVGVGQKIAVSGTAHEARLETAVRQAQGKLISNRILMGAGASSVIGIMAGAGTFGSSAGAALLGTAATAAAPYLAGAAMVAGTGGMVFDTVDKLRTLGKEKKDLKARLEAGETHIEKAVERQVLQTDENGNQIPVGVVNVVEVPIGERLAQIGKESRKHRLMATAMSGGMLSISGTVVAGGGLSMAPFALGPAALVAGGQSLMQLKKLHGEHAELTKLKESGQKMTTRDVESFDGSWGKTKVPISNLLAEVERKQKTQGMILTATASVTGGLALSLAGGMSVAAAAPLVLVPALLGAALFPGKAKEFAGKVAGFVTGFASEETKTRKDMVKLTKERTAKFQETAGELLGPMKEKYPGLVQEYPKHSMLAKLRGKGPDGPPAGYLTQLDSLINSYASKGSRIARAAALEQVNEMLGRAPKEIQSVMPALAEQIQQLHLDTEAAWVARDITLELKTPTTEKVVEDGRVAARLGETGFDSENIKPQYKEVLELENEFGMFEKTQIRHQAGDKNATKQLMRQQIFASSRALHTMEKKIGKTLMTKVVDAVHRPNDEENMELVTKEVAFKLRDPGSLIKGPDRDAYLSEPNLEAVRGQIQEVAGALATLSTPKTLVSDTQEDLNNTAHRALQMMANVDHESAVEMAKIQQSLYNPETFKGLSSQELGAKAKGLKKQFSELRREFPDTEMVDYWLDTEARARSGPEPAPGSVTQKSLDQARKKALEPLAALDPTAAAKLDAVDARMAEGFLELSWDEAKSLRGELSGDRNRLLASFKEMNPDAVKAFEVASAKASAGPPAQISAADAVPEQPLRGANARMVNAHAALREAEPKLAKEHAQAFAKMNDPEEFEGLDKEAVDAKLSSLNKERVKIQNKLAKKEPELVELWETARLDLDEEFFEQSIDREFLGRVVNQPSVEEATKRLGLTKKDAEAILMGMRRSQVLGSPVALNDALRVEGKDSPKVDLRKKELMGTLDSAIILTTGEMTNGGAEEAPVGKVGDPLNDPRIHALLEQNPVIEQVLVSPNLAELAKGMQISTEEAQIQYLTLRQVSMDPVAVADFQGKLQGGDLAALRTNEIGTKVDHLIAAMTRPDPELVAQHVEADMMGQGVATILGDANIQAAAEELGVDATATMRKVLTAQFSGDGSYYAKLKQDAQKGITAANNEKQMAEILSNAILQINQQMAEAQARAAEAAQAQTGNDPKAA